MSKGVIKSGGTYMSNLAGIAVRTPVNQQATRGLKGKLCDNGFCPTDLSIQQVECQFDNLIGVTRHVGARRGHKD
jgi:hypothetical protein